MDNSFKDRPNRLPWPPMIYVAALLLGAISGYFLHTPWPGSPLSDFLVAIGAVLVAVALVIDFLAMRSMAAAKTTIMPNKGSAHLVTTGPFRVSRNPIYLANTMITIGAGFLFGIIWFFPLAIIAAFMTQEMAIKREEAHLDARFGKAFNEYKKRVRRWL